MIKRYVNILVSIVAFVMLSSPVNAVEVGNKSGVMMTIDAMGNITSVSGGNNHKGKLSVNVGSVKFDATIDVNNSQQVKQMKVVTYADGLLTLGVGEVKVSFDVKSHSDYISFRVKEVEESFKGELLKLRFGIGNSQNVAIYPLDWMCGEYRPGDRSIEWPWIWGRNSENPLGSFALMLFDNDEQHDDTLLRIWANEELPHPQYGKSWDYEAAKSHLANWQRIFEDQSTMILQPVDNADLYRLADYAKSIGMKKVYLHTDSWRGEYWPIENSFTNVNRNIFPNGEVDFKKFGEYCKAQGLFLAIHTISGSIGRFDPDYARNGYHKDLATWVRGTVVEEVGKDGRVILFRPEEGSKYPRIIGHEWQGPNTSRSWIHIDVVQVGDELVKVGRFGNTTQDVWRLDGCQRGYFGSKATSHSAGTPARGLQTSYGQSFSADVDSELFKEVVSRYTQFDNNNYVSHIECDGLEIYNPKPWGTMKFQWKVCDNFDHPVTSNTSNGLPLRFQIEYWFKSSANVRANHTTGGVAGGDGVPMLLEQPNRLATTPYEILLKPSQRVAMGGSTFNLMRPIPMFGISTAVHNTYGLSGYIDETLALWRRVAKTITPEQRGTMSKNFGRFVSPFNSASNQKATNVLYRPEIIDGKLSVVPLQVMTQDRYDIKWGWGQEFGPIVPWQYAMLNEKVTIDNKCSDNEPEMLLRVMNGLSEVQSDDTTTHDEVVEESSVIDSYRIGAGQGSSNHPLSSAKQIWAAKPSSHATFRKVINVRSGRDLAAANLVLQVDGVADVYMNEHKYFSGGSAKSALSIDLGPYMREGENVLTIDVKKSSGNGALIAAIVMDLQGVSEVHTSDKSWLCSDTLGTNIRLMSFDVSKLSESKEIAQYGSDLFPRVAVKPRYTTVSLMPKGSDELVVEQNNTSSSEYVNKEPSDNWRVNAVMNRARGIAMTVVGDGSNSLLHIKLYGRGARDYMIPIDFKGAREIEIPCGEVAWSYADYGWRSETMHMDYGCVDMAAIQLARVPGKCHAKVVVTDLRIMQDTEVTITDPVIKCKGGSLKIDGSVKSGQYIWYRGGDKATLYDKNWNKVDELSVESKKFFVPKGKSELSISSKSKQPVYLQYLLVGRGEPILLEE